MVELLTSWLTNLKNADHVGVTIQILDAVKAARVTNDTYTSMVSDLEKAIAGEDDAYKKTQKDWSVEQLKVVDGEMDAYMKGIRAILTGHAALPDSLPVRQKALEMLQLWKDFNFKTSDSYSGEAAKVINMFQEVEKQKANAEEMGVWTYFEQAKKLALQIQELLNDRFNDMASRTLGEMRKARQATDLAIKQIFMVVNSLQVLQPSDQVTELVRKLRAIEDYAKMYYLRVPISGDELPPMPPTEDEGPGSDDVGSARPPGSSGD